MNRRLAALAIASGWVLIVVFAFQNDQQRADLANLRAQLSAGQQREARLTAERRDLQALLADTQARLADPTFVIWNAEEAVDARGLIGTVPDTMTYTANLEATVPVTLEIMSIGDYACRWSRLCAWRDAAKWGPALEIHAVFHEAEGCASYMTLVSSVHPGILRPQVSVTVHPASEATGVCR